MYFLYTLKIPKDLEEEIYFFLYEKIPQGWEWEEEEGFTTFRFYFKEENPQVLKELLAKYDFLEPKKEIIKEENWEISWKEFFKPFKVGKKFLILPPWEKILDFKERVCIYIEPGQAFGTGHHPTTQLMLENIEIFFENFSKKIFLEILDFGCGTGILGIACAKLYDNLKVYTLDIDEVALLATLQNAKLNQVEDKIEILNQLPKGKTFDLILANLSFKELKKEALNILKLSKRKKTKLFLSGILVKDVEKIKKLYQEIGFICEKMNKKEEWAFLEFFYA